MIEMNALHCMHVRVFVWLPWPAWIPRECKIWEAWDPQHTATKVQAKSTLFLLLTINSFFLIISFHIFTFSATPLPDTLFFASNPHSLNFFAKLSATLPDISPSNNASGFNFTAAVSVNMLTTADSTLSSAESTIWRAKHTRRTLFRLHQGESPNCFSCSELETQRFEG